MDYKKVVQTALNEVGYQGEKYTSKFSRFMDQISWYNGIKSGECTWCAIFYDYCIAVNKGDLTYEQARQIVCEPVKAANNTGAGCIQKAQMYKDAGQWISKASGATTGDQMFFKGSDGKIYHTGIVTGWDSTGLWVVDGSTTYNGKPNSVGKRHVSFTDFVIAGFGRPRWYMFDKDEKDKVVDIVVKVNAPDGVKVNIKVE